MTARKLPPYRVSLAGTLLAAREAVMAPIRPHLRDAGVTEQQWRVLRVLADTDGLDVSTLGEAAMLHPPSVTRILRELVERKLITREADGGDGRRSIIRLQPLGKTLVAHTAAHTLSVLNQYAQEFGNERLRILREELQAFTRAIDGLGNENPD